MTKEKYMALADFQSLWTDSIKPFVSKVFGASGTNHSPGLVPDPGATQGTTKYLREDGTWAALATSTDVAALQPPSGELDPQSFSASIAGKEDKTNKVTLLSSSSTDTQYPSAKCVYDALNSGLKVATISSAAAMSIAADKVTIVSGDISTAAITLTVPNDNNAHVWDILMTTDSTVAVTLTMSDSGTILYPDGYVLNADTVYEINVIGTNGTYYLRYGEFVTT